MHTLKAILKRRSIRRFKQRPVPYKKLAKIIDIARFAPSACNFQPWEFIIVDDKNIVDRIFPYTRWAGYLKDKGAPEGGRRPTAYIVVLINKEKCKFPRYAQADLGAVIENILLAATDMSIGSCWLGSIDRGKIARTLSMPKGLRVEYVVALGYPDEESKPEPLRKSHKYYKDKKGAMHVPKRKLAKIIRRNKY